jgi:4-cresol dehydrogenase (hydroxylating) flavoprotein subunit
MRSQSKPPIVSTLAAFERISHRLGADAISTRSDDLSRYGRTALPSAPMPIAIVFPKSKADVSTCLEIANEYRLPVYPISGGKNWGLGSACPTTQNQVVMDLSAMNRIVEVNQELGYAVIEPGVTQRQLYEYIQANHLGVWMDSTGAGPDATILGNLMERGYGHSPNGDRFHNSCAFEVVLADGTIMETGWAHNHASKVSNLFKTGLGPSLDGLFTQSNLGIVTRATVWLIPKPERFEAYAFRLETESQLHAAIDAFRPLRALGIVNSVVHLANDYRVLSSHHRFPYDQCSGKESLPESLRREYRRSMGIGRWNVLGGIYGTVDSVAGTRKAIRKALKSIARPIFITDQRLAMFSHAYRWGRWLPGMRQLKSAADSASSAVALLRGEPVADHLGGSAWRSRAPKKDRSIDPLERGDGIIWLTPLVPLTGKSCQDFLAIVEPIFEKHGFEPLLTFVMISGRAMCCPTTICYDRSSQSQCLRAQACYEALLEACLRHGYPPYRAGIQSMRALVEENDTYWATVSKLKIALDKNGVLAPGRYGQ